MIKPFSEEYSSDMFQTVLRYCQNYSSFKVLILLADNIEISQCFNNISEQDVKTIKSFRIVTQQQFQIDFHNNSKMWFFTPSESKGLRVNALIYSHKIPKRIVDVIYNPMLIQYCNRTGNNETLDFNNRRI